MTQQISMPMYSIPTESYNTFKVNWTASTQIEQLLPFKYDSLKKLILTMCLPRVLTTNNNYKVCAFLNQIMEVKNS